MLSAAKHLPAQRETLRCAQGDIKGLPAQGDIKGLPDRLLL